MIIQGKNLHSFDKEHSMFFEILRILITSGSKDTDPDRARGPRYGRIRSSTKDPTSEFSHMFRLEARVLYL
jgi:hypothetical protein